VDELESLRQLGKTFGDLPKANKAAARARLEGVLSGSETTPAVNDRAGLRRRRIVLLASVAVAACLVVAFATSLARNDPPRILRASPVTLPSVADSTVGPNEVAPGSNPYPPDALFDPETPLFGNGYQVTLSEAQRLSDHPIYRPNVDSSPQIWAVDGSDDEGVIHDVGLRYDSALVVLYTDIRSGINPADVYREEAEDWGVGYTAEIEGHEAWIISREENKLVSNVSVVHVAFDGVEVELQGKMSADQLVTVASTLQA
jgi:hypothetical protein